MDHVQPPRVDPLDSRSLLMGPLVVSGPVDPMPSKPLVSDLTVPQATTREPQGLGVSSGLRIFDLIAGAARVAVNASALVAGDVTTRTVKLTRAVLPAGLAEGPLEAIERQVGRRQYEARRSEQRNLGEVTKAAESVLNRVVVEIVDMLDMEQLIDHVPINRVVARVDLPAVIEEIDLSGIVREGTKGLGGETLDNARSGLMSMDQLSAGLIDKILRRREPRDLSPDWNGANQPDTVTSGVLT